MRRREFICQASAFGAVAALRPTWAAESGIRLRMGVIIYPDRAEFRKPGLCVFALADLSLRGAYRFSVRPVECFGRKGEPIVSDVFIISDDEFAPKRRTESRQNAERNRAKTPNGIAPKRRMLTEK